MSLPDCVGSLQFKNNQKENGYIKEKGIQPNPNRERWKGYQKILKELSHYPGAKACENHFLNQFLKKQNDLRCKKYDLQGDIFPEDGSHQESTFPGPCTVKLLNG